LNLEIVSEQVQKFLDKNKEICTLLEQKKFDEFVESAPLFVAKIIDFMGRLKRRLHLLEAYYKETEALRYSYYKFEFNIKLNNSEVKEFLERDSSLLSIETSMKELSSYIETLIDMKKNLESTRFDIKNWIELKKLAIELGQF
jgi:hypothetical protein